MHVSYALHIQWRHSIRFLCPDTYFAGPRDHITEPKERADGIPFHASITAALAHYKVLVLP